MFVLYSKDKNQENPHEETGKDQVQKLNERIKTNPGGGRDFQDPLDRPCIPPNLLYSGYGVILRGKAAGPGINHPPPSSV